jgi:cephalosporin hydroxylase
MFGRPPLFKQLRNAVSSWKATEAGRKFASSRVWQRDFPTGEPERNDFQKFFENRCQGLGVWKWQHYFDIYHRHLSKFRSKPVRIVEIGVYSGGSLDMWRNYFRDLIEIIGVDIEPMCKRYERPGVQILIGDQADRKFWAKFREAVPSFDIVVDDGGHEPHQQIATMEELLPYLNPGGVYICEDVHGVRNQFVQRIYGLADELNSVLRFEADHDNPDRRLAVKASAVQGLIDSITLYPFVVAIELRERRMGELVAPKRGTQWEPFLS